MKRKNMLTALALILVFALAMSACGKEEAPEQTTAAATTAAAAPVESTVSQPLELTDWTLSASTWSSPNGATIHITATPNYYAEGQSAAFLVRLESDEIANVPCQWDGSAYTASADLNAANGYCYYMVLTAADGTSLEVAVNTPAEPVNEAFINMQASLESYCSIVVEDSQTAEGKLTLVSGKVQVQAPAITNEGESITCKEAVLVLTHNGEELARQEVALTQAETAGLFEGVLENIIFELPEMEDDQSVELSLNATLSNDQALSAAGGSWFYNAEEVLPVVG